MEAATAWLKVIHISALLIWCAGLFYLPALFAEHTRAQDLGDFFRLRRMTRITYLAVVSPAAVIAVLSGSALVYFAGANGGWLALKLTVVALMVGFHAYCGSLLTELRARPVRRSAARLVALIAIPAILIPPVLWLVLAQPL